MKLYWVYNLINYFKWIWSEGKERGVLIRWKLEHKLNGCDWKTWSTDIWNRDISARFDTQTAKNSILSELELPSNNCSKDISQVLDMEDANTFFETYCHLEKLYFKQLKFSLQFQLQKGFKCYFKSTWQYIFTCLCFLCRGNFRCIGLPQTTKSFVWHKKIKIWSIIKL